MKITKRQLVKLIKEQQEESLPDSIDPRIKAFFMNLRNVLNKCPFVYHQSDKNNLYTYLTDCLFMQVDNSGFNPVIMKRLIKATMKVFDN